jgi:NADH:ubiquinone oxidoreductase subunit F (NADH-binding)/(2Fe-2S) ferredoxin/Pyruvate/2-oxoacid:ferredoxin oxidoreductase delta subunit
MHFSKPSDIDALSEQLKRAADPRATVITVCGGTGCIACGGTTVREAFENEVRASGLEGEVKVQETGCHGFCERGPVVVLLPEEVFYSQVSVDDVPEIVEKTVRNGEILERLLYVDPATGKKIVRDSEVPFYAKQQRIVFSRNGKINPKNLADYIQYDGYRALGKCLSQMTPEQVIDEISRAGLRGRGGAGFPTGRKWTIARNAPGDEKYMICNADEGDPGAFMDRSVLEGDPHAVLEGMAIAGYAIGARHGHIYVRAEYPLAVENTRKALRDAREAGLLGDNILGTDFCFDIRIEKGAGAFVCGEETALIASVEGRRGMPRPRPPFPAVSGLWGKPTNINNVETLANVAPIILKGADWYAGIGTENSKGTKIFALAGKVNNTGLVEVPMGATIRDIVFEIGGGIPGGREFKAVQMGGPSGGCVPAEHLDLPIDYDSIADVGAIMGSGGLIVMDDATCMVDVARFFIDFVQKETCGKCVPCRVGTKRMLDILTRITDGEGVEGDIEKLERLANVVKPASLCGLGQTAPNPVLTTIRYFRDEYEAHIRDKKCPAGVCQALLSYSIDPEKCTGCHACAKVCPTEAATGEKKEPHTIDRELCIKCGACFEACKFEAILVE